MKTIMSFYELTKIMKIMNIEMKIILSIYKRYSVWFIVI